MPARVTAQLPDDAVRLVLSFLDDIDLRTMASVSSALYERARHVQRHTMHIPAQTDARRPRRRRRQSSAARSRA
ncbi:hypothetical protein VE04_09822, partial [Pseudogymnoascus sp. 24MN13]